MQLTRTLYNTSILFFTGFLMLVLWGFWRTYFSNPLQLPDVLTHLHGFSMTLWCAMLVTQAALIRKGQRRWHRAIGKASYALAPIMFILMVSMVRDRFPKSPVVVQTGALPDFGFFAAALTLGGAAIFGLFYGLAIWNRRNPQVHGRLMLCTIFPIAAAPISRIINDFPGFRASMPQIGGQPAPQFVTWTLADSLLIGLAIWDWRAHRRTNVFPAVLLLLLAYHIFTANAHHIGAWRSFCNWFLGIAA